MADKDSSVPPGWNPNPPPGPGGPAIAPVPHIRGRVDAPFGSWAVPWQHDPYGGNTKEQ